MTRAPASIASADRRERLDDPRRVADAAAVERHVEVDPQEEAPAAKREIADPLHAQADLNRETAHRMPTRR